MSNVGFFHVLQNILIGGLVVLDRPKSVSHGVRPGFGVPSRVYFHLMPREVSFNAQNVHYNG